MKPALPITNILDQRQSKPYPNFGSSMPQIRDEKQITIGELATGNPVGVLAVAVGSLISAIEVAA